MMWQSRGMRKTVNQPASQPGLVLLKNMRQSPVLIYYTTLLQMPFISETETTLWPFHSLNLYPINKSERSKNKSAERECVLLFKDISQWQVYAKYWAHWIELDDTSPRPDCWLMRGLYSTKKQGMESFVITNNTNYMPEKAWSSVVSLGGLPKECISLVIGCWVNIC